MLYELDFKQIWKKAGKSERGGSEGIIETIWNQSAQKTGAAGQIRACRLRRETKPNQPLKESRKGVALWETVASLQLFYEFIATHCWSSGPATSKMRQMRNED